jgi:hypothetical protein
MEVSNQKRSKRIKRSFNIMGVVIVIVGLILLWLKKDTAVLITAGVFILYVGMAQFADLCFINYNTDNGRIRIKYFPVISIMKKEYDSIEFTHEALYHFNIENSMGFSDLSIAIKTKRGVAEYPSISLAAMNKSEIEQIRSSLSEILQKNRTEG